MCNILFFEVLGFYGIVNGDKNLSLFRFIDMCEIVCGYLVCLFYLYNDIYMVIFFFCCDGYFVFGIINFYVNFFLGVLVWIFINENFWNWKLLSFGKLCVLFG